MLGLVLGLDSGLILLWFWAPFGLHLGVPFGTLSAHFPHLLGTHFSIDFVLLFYWFGTQNESQNRPSKCTKKSLFCILDRNSHFWHLGAPFGLHLGSVLALFRLHFSSFGTPLRLFLDISQVLGNLCLRPAWPRAHPKVELLKANIA